MATMPESIALNPGGSIIELLSGPPHFHFFSKFQLLFREHSTTESELISSQSLKGVSFSEIA